MKTIKFTVPGQLPGANQHIKACNANYRVGNKLKQDTEEMIMWHAVLAKVHKIHFDRAHIKIKFIEKNQKRDQDNIMFGTKYILDALRHIQTIPNDGWKNIASLNIEFDISKENPRVEIELTEVE